MNIATISYRSLQAALYRVLNPLCERSSSAVKIACVPNGSEHRFVVLIDERWRHRVYSLLAERTSVTIPADAGPLNLSPQQAQEVGKLSCGARPTAGGAPRLRSRLRRLPDVRGDALEHTFRDLVVELQQHRLVIRRLRLQVDLDTPYPRREIRAHEHEIAAIGRPRRVEDAESRWMRHPAVR